MVNLSDAKLPKKGEGIPAEILINNLDDFIVREMLKNLEGKKTITMQDLKNARNEIFLGEFLHDPRALKLRERLNLYYDQTPLSMNNKKAMRYYREFRLWCDLNGYNQKDISNVILIK
jgi:hypothetical protein